MRLTAKLLLPLLMAAFICGCSGTDSGTLTLAIGGAPDEIAYWERLISRFELDNDIEVNILRQPTDTDQRRQGLLIALKSGQADPDVFLMDVAWLAQFAASNWLEALDSMLESGSVSEAAFFERILNRADRYRNQLVAFPVYVDGGVLYYRTDLLAAHGFKSPPETWAELVETSRAIQEKERKNNPYFYGYLWQGAQYEGLVCNFLEVAASGGGGIIEKENRILVASPENIRAAKLMKDFIHKYEISPPSTYTEMKEEETRLFFQRGQALFERNWPYAWLLHQQEESAVKGVVGIATLPHFEGGRSVSTLGGWHIGLSRFSDRKDDARTLIKFILSYETQKALALNLGWTPGRRDVYRDSLVLASLPHLADLAEAFENALPRPNFPYYTQISEILQRHLNAILSGESEAERALGAAEREINEMAGRYRDTP